VRLRRPCDPPPDVQRWLETASLEEADRAFRAHHAIRMPRKREEQSTTGLSVDMQGIGSSGYGDQAWLGIEWPAAPFGGPSDLSVLGVGRYLAVLDAIYVPERSKKRIRGIRLLRKLRAITNADSVSASVPPRPTELQVSTVDFHFPDSALSFHLRRIPRVLLQSLRQGPGPFDAQNFAFRFQNATPALLYEDAEFHPWDLNFRGQPDYYQNLIGYVPPNQGRPYGVGIGAWGTFYDLRSPWDASQAWNSLDLIEEGPATIALFAALRQTNPATRTALEVPDTFYPGGLAPEEQFILNYPNAYEGRCAGSIVWEDV
jgi:hypothetical protein